MHPYFKIKLQDHATVEIPGSVQITANIVRVCRLDNGARIDIPQAKLTRSEAIAFIKAGDMLLNFAAGAGVNVRYGGGGRVPWEYNDGAYSFYFDKSHTRKVTYMDGAFNIPGRGQIGTAELRRFQKVMQTALSVTRSNRRPLLHSLRGMLRVK